MPSKKRDMKIDLTQDIDFPDYDVLLPAAVRFARDLLCGNPNETSAVLMKESIKHGRCHITLRFPDGEVRECYFGKALGFKFFFIFPLFVLFYIQSNCLTH